MKKLAVLMLSAGLLLGAANAEAVDFKVKGSFQFVMDYVNGGNFMGKRRDGHHVQGQQWAPSRQQRDEFESVQRVHMQIEAVASESLSGMLFLEIGEQRWGYGSQGGAMGADGTMVRIKRAYVDWTVPNTDLSLRMGIIGIRMPGFSIDSPILDTDLAGVTASYHFNENVSLGAGWLLRFIRRRFPCEDATLVALPGRKPLLTRWRVRETAEEASPHTSAQGGWRQDSAPANNC